MRTTLTLDPDVAALLAQEMRRSGTGLKTTMNRELCRALAGAPVPASKRFRIQTHSFGFRPGTDLDRLNQIYDELEAASALARLEGS